MWLSVAVEGLCGHLDSMVATPGDWAALEVCLASAVRVLGHDWVQQWSSGVLLICVSLLSCTQSHRTAMIFWSGRKDSLFSSATGCCTPTGLSPSPERTGWNTTYRFWLWYQHQPCFTCSPQNLPNHRGYFQKGPMDTEYVMPTNKQNKQTKPLKSILNKKKCKEEMKMY